MKIISGRRTVKTKRLLEESMPDSLKNVQVFINLGNSDYDTSGYYNWKIVNHLDAIRNCANKIRMFNIFKENDVKCLDFFKKGDMKNYGWRGFIGSKAVLKKGKRIRITRLFRGDWDYGTVFERKEHEYRVVVYKGAVLRAMEKIPLDGNMDILKQKKCRFEHRPWRSLNRNVVEESIKACKALGIDLAGVDVLINNKGEVKVIEVNSGMAMGHRTAGRLFRRIEREEGLR